MSKRIEEPETPTNGCGAKHLKLTLGWLGILLVVVLPMVGWAYAAVTDVRDRIAVVKESAARNDERLKNIEKNTAENNTMLRELMRGGKP